MKFKKQRDEEERLERAAKIQAHLKKTAPTYSDDEPITWSEGEVAAHQGTAKADHPTAKAATAGDSSEPKAIQRSIYPPLQPWQQLDRFGRRYQYRPMTSRELDEESDRRFMESQRKQEEAHAKRLAAAKTEQETEQKRMDKRREHERRTGMRPMGRDQTCTLEEARRLGYLDAGNDDSSSNGNNWSSAGNPDGIMGGGR